MEVFCSKTFFTKSLFFFALKKLRFIIILQSAHTILGCFSLDNRNIAQLAKVKVMKKSGKWENLEIPQR